LIPRFKIDLRIKIVGVVDNWYLHVTLRRVNSDTVLML